MSLALRRVTPFGTMARVQQLSLSAFDDAAKRRDLRKMKVFATGLLGFATVVYIFCRWQESRGAGEWVGYVRAASEAGMVGALADWFAVTALFRHPMGLPIPHTAIIKRKKDQLGASLSSFVGQNFLAPEVVSAKVQQAQIPLRLGTWMAEPANAARVAAETSTVLRGMVEVLRDEDIAQIIDNTIVKRLAEPMWGPPIGRVLGELLKDNKQLPIIELLAERAHQWALGSQETIDRVIVRDSPAWSPKFVDAMLGEKIYKELVEFTWKVRSNPEHEVRLAANRFLIDFADDLQNDPETIKKAEGIKAEIMGREEVTGLASSTWQVAKRLIMESVDDPNSTLRTKVAENVAASESGCVTTSRCVRRSTAGWCRAPSTSRRTTPTRSPGSSVTRSSDGMPTKRARRSSCRSVEIFSSSVSTAPLSARLPGC
ncbi:hypothetical protein GCM10020255_061080 [Rhodococcus baikonurensis]